MDDEVLWLTEGGPETKRDALGDGVLIKAVLDRCTTVLVEDMVPQPILDKFIEAGTMTFTQIRDISEQALTSEKNRKVREAIRRNPSNYHVFKTALTDTLQTNIVTVLNDLEVKIHNEMKVLGYVCKCHVTNQCALLQKLRCSTHISPLTTVSTSSELQAVQTKLVSIYTDFYQHLPVNPLTAEITEPLAGLYVQPSVVVAEYANTSLQPEFVTDSNEVKVQSLRDVFLPHTNTIPKLIYIMGEAGTGKTTLCKYMLHCWCNVQGKRRETMNMVEDETVMSNFDLLFYIPLPEYGSCGDIETMIGELIRQDIQGLLKEQRCLVILDGLDNWSMPNDYRRPVLVSKGLPNRDLTIRYTCLITTRPWKLAVVKPRKNEINHLMKVKGLDSDACNKLVRNLLNVLKKGRSDNVKSQEMFFKCIEKSGLEPLVHVPSILTQLVCLWHSGQPFGNTYCETFANMIEYLLTLANVEDTHSSSTTKGVAIPPSFDKHHCRMYWKTLSVLSQFAFHSVFNGKLQIPKAVQSSGIFSLATEERNIARTIGLLSESNEYGKSNERVERISFIHEPFQDILAALFVVVSEIETIDKIFRICCTIESILEISNILIFISGMKSGFCGEISEKIMHVVDGDKRFVDYRLSTVKDHSYPHWKVIEKVQNLVTACTQEGIRCGTCQAQTYLHDIVLDRSTIPKFGSEGLSVLSTQRLKSVFIKTDVLLADDPTDDVYQCLSDDVTQSRALQKLHIDDSRHALPVMTVFGLICQFFDSLTTLCLEWVNLHDLGKRFSLVYEKMSLVSFCLRYSRLTHDQLSSLQKGLLQYTDLKELELKEIRCVDCLPDTCKYTLLITESAPLKKLTLEGLDADRIQFSGEDLIFLEIGRLCAANSEKILFDNIPENNNITELHCSECSDIDALLVLLNRVSKIRTLHLSRIDMGKRMLSISSNMTSLSLIRLENVTMSRKSGIGFVTSLAEVPCTVRAELVMVSSESHLLVLTSHLRRNSADFELIKDTAKEVVFYTLK